MLVDLVLEVNLGSFYKLFAVGGYIKSFDVETPLIVEIFVVLNLEMLDLLGRVEVGRQLFAQSATPTDLENAKAQFLGKSGRVTELMKGMAQLSVEEVKNSTRLPL